jgi:hypothetical protein
VPLAEGSGKAAVEHQHNILATPEVCKSNGLSIEVSQGKIWRLSIDLNFRHAQIPYDKY